MSTTRCYATPDGTPKPSSLRPSTGSTARWSNARSLGWSVAATVNVRYRGTMNNDAWPHHRIAALNLRRLLTLGLEHRDGAWALA